MADEEGLLSQDDIKAALSEAGLDPGSVPGGTEGQDDPPAEETDSQVDSGGRPSDEDAAGMAEAVEQEKTESPGSSAQAPADGEVAASGAMPLNIPELADKVSGTSLVDGIDLLRDVELNVKIELGRSRMLVDDVLRLSEGSVVELDKLAGDPVDVFVNDRLVARGEVLVLNDNFCVRINDVVKQEGEEES